jgi:hypothetical protein
MGYFGKQVGRPLGAAKGTPHSQPTVPAGKSAQPAFAAHVGKALAQQSVQVAVVDHCPRCNGVLAEADGFGHCQGRCGKRWVTGGPGRWLDPATLPFGACGCCRPRLALVAAEVGAICPGSHAEYLILPEGVKRRDEVAPLGICRCCLPPQPLIQVAGGLACRNKPQQHYRLEKGEVIWLGLAPALDQATVTAAIDAALSANNAELTLFGLFAPPADGH